MVTEANSLTPGKSVAIERRPPVVRAPVSVDGSGQVRGVAAELPGYCRHDDYMYLPPGATAGLPCGGAPTAETPGSGADPRAWALLLAGQLPVPELSLAMNPRLGLVRLPTWFWVDGYGGEVRAASQSVALQRQDCQRQALRDAAGDAVLDGAGAPQTSSVCQTVRQMLAVQVRLFPRRYRWSFGDGASQTVACSGDPGTCRAGLGDRYQDPEHPSSIAHSYTRSSLHVGGAYTVTLALDFAAEYRWQLDDAPMSAWAELPERHPSWSVSHPVQEAQAVLTSR